MERLTKTIQSYLNLREALLRQLRTKPPTGYSWYTLINLTPNTRCLRQADPTTWRFDELIQLAKVTGTSDQAIHAVKLQLSQVKAYVETLPDKERQRFYKTCELNAKKLGIRQQDDRCWRIIELQRMVMYFQSVTPS